MKGKLKYGCAGCGVVLLLIVTLAAGILGFAWLGLRNESPRAHAIRPQIESPDDSIAAPPSGTVFVDLYHADLELLAAGAGESLQVDCEYDDSAPANPSRPRWRN